jgi:hypothetical protein
VLESLESSMAVPLRRLPRNSSRRVSPSITSVPHHSIDQRDYHPRHLRWQAPPLIAV